MKRKKKKPVKKKKLEIFGAEHDGRAYKVGLGFGKLFDSRVNYVLTFKKNVSRKTIAVELINMAETLIRHSSEDGERKPLSSKQ